jgi:hypothetical protein
MSRLERIEREMQRTRDRIVRLQTRLKELDGQLTEVENTEIVAAIRALKMTPGELREFIRCGVLPARSEDRAAIVSARFERKPKPRTTEPDKPARAGKPDPAIPVAAPTDTDTDKESEVKTDEA